jgi:hypothetical protein
MTNRMAFTARSFPLRLALTAAIIFCFVLWSRAGGPKCVAGTRYFDSTTTGQALAWPQGQIIYYTDQGDLSPILNSASANSFVANAFSRWTSVPTAALSATNSGALAEDVSGTNVTVNSDGTISIPTDIQPTATGTPIGVVCGLDYRFDVFPGLASRNSSDGTDPPPTARLPVRIGRWVEIRGR